MAEDGAQARLIRPKPPAELVGIDGALDGSTFVPAPELEAWLRESFINDGAALQNEDHVHLQFAHIGCVWTNFANGRGGRSIIGQAEYGPMIGGMGKWQRERARQQIASWFGDVPDFVVTIYAPYVEECSDAQFCALVEHELYHCGQDRDVYGAPKFRKSTGLPAFTLRAHDVEEFAGVVRRYGGDAAGVRALIDAVNEGPTIADADLRICCGTCSA